MRAIHLFPLSLAVGLTALLSVQMDNALSFHQQWALLLQPSGAQTFADFQFLYSALPRAVMALIIGAMLGLVGSLMQQLTQNPLTSPLTLGTSSGAWLTLIIVTLFFPDWAANYHALAAMSGALLAFGLVVVITGLPNMMSLQLVVAGMVVNLLLGAIATAIILLNAEFAQNVFMWGAGDLAQNGWDWVIWLLPRLVLAIPLLFFAPRILMLMRLGQQGAAARGLAVIPAFFFLMVCGIWLVSASITAVGMISFIGLLTPNLVRGMGVRTPKMALYACSITGAFLLLLTDMLSMGLSQYFGEVVPSGVTAAVIGAPALIWFSCRQVKAQDMLVLRFPRARLSIGVLRWFTSFAVLVAGVSVYSFVTVSDTQWLWQIPNEYQWLVRYPRIITAIFSGWGLAVAGTILQRLIYNPLASPDILGVSSGATFALVFVGIFFGQTAWGAGWLTAFLGSVVILGILLLAGKRYHYAPANLILTGIAITALLQALVQFCLVKGTAESYQILLWLSGSTYRVSVSQALWLAVGVSGLCVIALALSRWLSLLSIGRQFAFSRGLSLSRASLVLLLVVALLCACVTATMGPVAFVGLMAPHIARTLGARQVIPQLVLSGVIGSALMVWADWLGSVMVYPMQIAAGTLVAIIGGIYFFALLIFRRAE